MKYFLMLVLFAFPVYAEKCQKETKETFEKHAFSSKFRMDASCAVFYKDAKKHTACWTDSKSPVGVPLTNVRCKK